MTEQPNWLTNWFYYLSELISMLFHKTLNSCFIIILNFPWKSKLLNLGTLDWPLPGRSSRYSRVTSHLVYRCTHCHLLKTEVSPIQDITSVGLGLCVFLQSLSRIRLIGSPWTVACKAPQFTDFSRQEYWSGLPFPIPRGLSNLTQGSNLSFLCLLPWKEDSLPQSHLGIPLYLLSTFSLLP